MKTPSELLEDKNTFTTTLMAIMYQEYGTEFLDWDPLTINLSIKRDFKVTPSQDNKDKIQAGSIIIGDVSFYQDFEVFATACGVVAMSGYSTDTLVPPDLDDVAWTCLEAKLLDDEFSGNMFSDDIKRYVGILLDEEGIYDPPSLLDFAVYPKGRRISDSLVAEDETLSKAMLSMQKDKKRDFAKILRDKTVELFGELRDLSIEGKNVEYIKQAMERLG